ncbi:hypothetical protein [Alienimonas californiensis]|uniref:Uncharacterized protein n=1 Tax=Alienimonas californiensis TaxID=2527989 RepID=A0A517P763_9PLAN|nr:hypothetical protein [Alienimonas californiensis]QDT15195.1 hypothetical protein CA12_12760 [Alienimonas californiensis]
MNAASPAVFDLPPEIAAALDARREVLVRHPGTGAQLRLVPEPKGASDEETNDEPFDGYRSGKTLEESVRAGLAQADAGLGMTTEEVRAEMARRHPELRNR